MNIRYRLLHNHYPYELDQYYNFLCTKWRTVLFAHSAIYNTYGYTVNNLYFHITFPIDGRQYTNSVFVDSEQIRESEGGVYFCQKSREEGKYEITAMMHTTVGSVAIYKSGRIEGTYNKDTRNIFVNFTPERFLYP